MKQNLIRVHSNYSVHDGLATPEQLVQEVVNLGLQHLPITEHSNTSSWVKLSRACEAQNIKPVYGVDIKIDGLGLVCFFAKNNEGLVELRKLASEAQKNNEVIGEAQLFLPDLSNILTEDNVLIFIDQEQASSEVFQNNKGHLSTLDLALKYDLLKTPTVPDFTYSYVVPSVDVYFVNSKDKITHDVRVAIQRSELLSEFESEFSDLMSFHSESAFADLLPEKNSFEFKSAESVFASFTAVHEVDVVRLPSYPYTDGISEDEFFSSLVAEKYEERIASYLRNNPRHKREDYDQRLRLELDVLLSMGYSGYFLIVWDYITWAKGEGIAVGIGRGSAGGSLVAAVLGIVEIDPLKYDLLFERFLNPERKSLPDVDTDFDSARRSEVIDYAKRRFGEEIATQICTFGRMKAKAVMNDVARVLGVKSLSSVIPAGPEVTLSDELAKNGKLKELSEMPEHKELFEFALRLEGLPRSIGRHAGGVVISNGSMFGCTGLYRDAKGNTSVMLDMNDSEAVGLVKFDFLSLGNLSTIDRTIEVLKSRGIELDIDHLNLNDSKVYAFLCRALTEGIFQLHSSGMKALVRKIKPDNFEDIIALLALFRPGPLRSGMVDNFVARKHGQEEVSYPDSQYQHEMLKGVLEPTYGIILYQEQVMQIAQVMAGYSLGEADLLRRAMGKKKPEEMEKQKKIFIEGSRANGVDSGLSEKIFNLVDKFSGYGFNKSHSAAYGLITYQTAYLKTHYTATFMAEVLTKECDDHAKLARCAAELSSYGVKLLPPCINNSNVFFHSPDEQTIRFGLSAMKQIGENFARSIVKERDAYGPFRSVEEFYERMEANVSKTQLTVLSCAGAFEQISEFGDCLDLVVEKYDFEKTKFAISTDLESMDFNQKLICGIDFRVESKLSEFSDELKQAKCIDIGALDDVSNGTKVLCGGLTIGAKIITSKGKSRFVGELRDASGSIVIVGWSEFVSRYGDTFKDDDFFIVEGRLGSYNDKKQLTLNRAWDKEFVRKRLARD